LKWGVARAMEVSYSVVPPVGGGSSGGDFERGSSQAPAPQQAEAEGDATAVGLPRRRRTALGEVIAPGWDGNGGLELLPCRPLGTHWRRRKTHPGHLRVGALNFLRRVGHHGCRAESRPAAIRPGRRGLSEVPAQIQI